MIEQSVEKEYGNRLRTRVAGIYLENDMILLVNHSGLNEDNEFWAPPGGGMVFGESAVECLCREYEEETGLEVSVKDFLCCSEYINPPLHAVELFFNVSKIGGRLLTGEDPEVAPENQIIRNVKFLSFESLSMIPEARKHSVLHGIRNPIDFGDTKGYRKFPV